MSLRSLLTLGACALSACRAQAAPEPPRVARTGPLDTSMWKKPGPEEIQRRLRREQLEVTQNNGTEPPFRNEFWNNHADGIYVDVVSGEPLFSSHDKFESGSGWPSFVRPLEPTLIVEKRDSSRGMVRVEVRSKIADSHLGHLFDDGPKPTGQRYCINSAALRFIPAAELEAEGYGQYAGLFPGAAKKKEVSVKTETAILAGGCFWGMEDLLRKIPGVLETDVGYSGGTFDSPRYEDMKTGRTGHAEAVRIVFDPAKLSYADLLENWFFRMHDPTTVNRQGNDVGTQYRSAIFYLSEAQKQAAEQAKAKVDAAKKWPRPIVTEVTAAGTFFPAEGYHQDYLEKNPGGYTCHFLRDW